MNKRLSTIFKPNIINSFHHKTLSELVDIVLIPYVLMSRKYRELEMYLWYLYLRCHISSRYSFPIVNYDSNVLTKQISKSTDSCERTHSERTVKEISLI
jgi:hypothetical protein